jgi:hypothetical protein
LLKAVTGLSREHPAAVDEIDLVQPASPWGLHAKEALRLSDAVVFSLSEHAELRDLPGARGALGRRGRASPDGAGGRWPEPSTKAVVLPIVSSEQDSPLGFFISGINPRRPFDAVRRLGRRPAARSHGRAHRTIARGPNSWPATLPAPSSLRAATSRPSAGRGS